MDSKTLKKGISILLDMEMSNYLMYKLAEDIRKKESTLGRAQRIDAPNEKFFFSCFEGDKLGMCAVVIPACVMGLAGLIAWLIKKDLYKVFEMYFSLYDDGLSILLGSLAPFLIGFLGYLTYVIVNDIKNRIRIRQKYNNDVYLYKVSLAMDEGRVEDEHAQIQALEVRRNELIFKQKETQRNLTAFYDKMGIDRKFRSLVAMGYMEELIRLGASDHLEGIDGLYYLVRKDLRQDQMQATLEQISSKLDMIINNQSTLYDAIVDMNNQCTTLLQASMNEVKKLNKSADIIAENSRITAYTAERIQKEEEYRNFMLTYAMFR